MSKDADYAQTIHLPKTDFPRRAGLAQKEPLLQARWEKMGLYQKQRAASQGRKKFILHMGPPFANGDIHLGHVLTTALKDIVCRSYQMLGYDAPLVPGFDCHGLPIEWKVDEAYRAKGQMDAKDKDRVAFLKACRDFASGWIEKQTEGFKRLGILADWDNPYLTMAPKSEATIAGIVHEFIRNGALYRGSKPVMWSTVEQTALAEAEIEYKDVTSDTVWVRFPIATGLPQLTDAHVVIWTTTPWTLPGNRAIGYGAALDYVAIEVVAVGDESLAAVGDKLLICADLRDSFLKSANILEAKNIWSGKGADLAGVICHHPLQGQGYDFNVPLLPGDFVTTDAGTGFVHIAPGHGEDDYRLGLAHGVDVPHTVDGDGRYFDHVPLFAGLEVYTSAGKKGPANKAVIAALEQAGKLIARGQITHSYPHSWRSKAPVIFRNTPQWFISMEKNNLREKALAEIAKTRFVPERGRNRIGSMVEQRGDWNVSRQRVWGVPLAIFYDRDTGEPLNDEGVFSRIAEIFEREGSESWYTRPAQDFLGPDHDAARYEQVRDIVDVWMESGITQEFVLRARPELAWPADLYLEGSDQHRGWFQSSLLVACGTRGQAPYKAVLTHGFILDEKGYKMSKSVGNVTDPAKLMENYGADILRLWATGSDFTEDVRFGENILKGHADIYRRIRGTLCYLLGSLDGKSAPVSYDELSDLDRYVLHRLHQVDAQVCKAIEDYDFQEMTTVLHNFCARDLSAFYFDICKDILYCDPLDGQRRRAVVTVLDQVFNFLVHWLSPILAYTTEEAWLSYKGLGFEDVSESIHLSQKPDVQSNWYQPQLADKWQRIIDVRSVVTSALERKREEKMIGSALESAPKVYVSDDNLADILMSVAFHDICITSGIEIIKSPAPATAHMLADVPGVAVEVVKAQGKKCARCWKYSDDVGRVEEHDSICGRCADAIHQDKKIAA